jgi:hypothetical protein
MMWPAVRSVRETGIPSVLSDAGVDEAIAALTNFATR